ncbi:DUF1800 domain-containing protein [Gemmata sp. JC717]|uniref:DUF1800 domain-containing protein n=1 Tax=Gemmata algarum TaxID=2975278 RepID=UPI0021BB19B0|nr:DUF1800 domain-containing protein [Gemmata algarum]MDY3553352.1 DUF1800 domain-containing protein [Gemmata algarum]
MAAPLPLSPLDQIDPADAWKPWAPSASDPWDRTWAAHLYRRAAFGASGPELARAVRAGHAATLELLLNGTEKSGELVDTLNDVGRVAATRDTDGTELRGWWLYCMLQGGHPLREKLALFWHNHFATSIAKVREPGLMFRQNVTFRAHALGRFGPLLHAVTRDPAMLVWLDSNTNVKGKPNENYARELMELFSLGVGNYSEADVREAARSFSGWHTSGSSFRFNAAQHDGGPKTVLGRTGNWDGNAVVKIVLDQPACARFLVRKLYAAFVSELPLPERLLEPLGDTFRKSGYDIAALMRTILGSRLFYSGHALRKRIGSPIEYALGAVRATYRRYEEDDAHFRPLAHQRLLRWLAGMGQVLFAPPNVKGWPGGKTWLNTATVLERNNFAAALVSGTLWMPPLEEQAFVVSADVPPPKAFDPARVLEEENVTRPADVVRALLDRYVPGGVRAAAREKLVAFVAEDAPTGLLLARRAREVAHAILTMPEAQLV